MEVSQLPTAGWIAIGVLFVIEIGLLIWALADWFRRRPEQFNGNRWLWLVLILFFNMLGPIIYLLAGRKAAIVEAAAPATPTADRAQTAADTLYGAPAVPSATSTPAPTAVPPASGSPEAAPPQAPPADTPQSGPEAGA